ncbi:FAD-dependent monooxygenase [Planotetraspora phitsanulokensis]|uniref:Monooxygenase n=1 Tax=Planotetraspora phitsanulokensis TaxID=575192 RepID=A0A8J3U4C9_9ACTN|nr:FAD-dependent monooxygenase [Planotetraspora phitsanulokensis]GII36777.1 monooxygenase [Planotetraspora phitsanulokensis]
MNEDHSNGPHVLVIGGGVGGLCLAQGLRKSGIRVDVYERDRSARFRGQGWRISLKEEGTSALRSCLPEDLFELCVATAILPATRMAFLDHLLNPKFEKPVPLLPHDVFFGVNRLTLREILLSGLDDVRHFGKTFVRYDHAGDGRVRAHFADGTVATGDLLVGADGTNSAVRRQLLPAAEVDDIGNFVYGRTPITPGMLDWLPDVLVDSFNRLIAPGDAAMSVVTCRTREPVPEAVARLAPGARLTDMPGYLAWMVSSDERTGWAAGPSLTAERFRQSDGETLHRLARETVADFHPLARRILDEADVPATFPVGLRSARPVSPWPTTDVTLLGDAVHTMSPGRGEGANTTLRHAELLRQALVGVAARGVPLLDAVGHYEAEMLHHGFQMVSASLGNPLMPRPSVTSSPRPGPRGAG